MTCLFDKTRVFMKKSRSDANQLRRLNPRHICRETTHLIWDIVPTNLFRNTSHRLK